MSRVSILCTALAVSVVFSAPTGHASSQFGLFRGSKPKLIPLASPALPFVAEYPDNWRMSHAGAASVTLTQPKDEATVIMDRQLLEDRPLVPDEIGDLLMGSEAGRIKENYPKASDIRPRTQSLSGRRVVVVDFKAPGLKPNETELVRQYTIPIDLNLFRVTCRATAQYFKKYEALFEQMAESVQAARPAGTAKH
jgi:hypothetical protein